MCINTVSLPNVPYTGKFWQGKTLANENKFAKVSPAKIYACTIFVEQILTLKGMKCACSTA